MQIILWIPVIAAISILAGIAIGRNAEKKEKAQQEDKADAWSKIYGRVSKLERQINGLASHQGLIWKKEDYSLPKWENKKEGQDEH